MVLLPILVGAAVATGAGIGGVAQQRAALERQSLRVQRAWRDVEFALIPRHDAVAAIEAACRAQGLVDERDLDALASAVASAARPGGLPVVRSVVETLLDRAIAPVMDALPDPNPDIAELRDRLIRANRQLAAAREKYNAAASRANSIADRLPARLLTRPGRGERFEYFELAEPACGPGASVIYEC